MVLILLLLSCNHDTKNTSEKTSHLDKGWLFTGSFKILNVPGIINQEVLIQFTDKAA